MRKNYLVLLATLLVLGCESEPPIVGSMSKSSVCSTAGYLIRQELGKNFRTISQKCVVKNTGGDNVEIESGYVSPINPTPFRYTAQGHVRGNNLVLQRIRVHGIDEEYVPFTSLGG
ncbi:hypothetical protein [Oceanobacter antarcticus]|uniref:Uncharacterized protein n=1 Tax=Oceanobacter antarcticus TaxID=3133425 RepID=A0ABW8NPH0_9GAMM